MKGTVGLLLGCGCAPGAPVGIVRGNGVVGTLGLGRGAGDGGGGSDSSELRRRGAGTGRLVPLPVASFWGMCGDRMANDCNKLVLAVQLCRGTASDYLLTTGVSGSGTAAVNFSED